MNSKKINAQKTKSKKTFRYLLTLIIILSAAIILFFLFKDEILKNNSSEEYSFTKNGELSFTDSLDRQKAKINIEIADDEFKRQLGLMKRSKMNNDEGMLFIFPNSEMQSFWMLNTLIPLDIIYADSNKKIITIHKNTIPLSLSSYPSTAPSKYVVEVKGGSTDSGGIVVGDKISWVRTTNK